MSAEIIPLPVKRPPGASKEDWQHFDLVLGLTEDLLPVVCNTEAQISPRSELKPAHIGRVPCQYDKLGHMVGLPNWTKAISSGNQIERWMKQADYGICLITREVRALDIDVTDAALADAITQTIERTLGMKLPIRRRENIAKRLLAVRVAGDLGKRRLEVAGGEVVEFLGTGQMFVAAGSRADGSRYYWDGGLPDVIPTITPEQLDLVWQTIEVEFGVGPSVISQAPGEGKADLDREDPVADYLAEKGLVLSEHQRGLAVQCPWEDEHTGGEIGDGSTMWLHAGGKGNELGHFKCMHAHCARRSRADYLQAIGYVEDVTDEFDTIEDTPEEAAERKAREDRFTFVPVAEVANLPSSGWIVKGIVPQSELGILYGPSGAGKSFVMLDLAMSIARGIPWRGCRVKQGKVRYIVAEGKGGFRKRIRAYALRHGVDLAQVPMAVMETAPNFLMAEDVKAVAKAVRASDGADVVIVDTLAKVTPGANENAGEDMGKAIDNCRRIAEATGALVILVHHTGKDIERGARGWSGIKAAADFEAEVCRDLASGKRWLQITKQKDGDDEGRWGFKLEDVVLGQDEDGDDVTSCVITEDELPEMGKGRKPEKMGAWEQAVFDSFTELQLGGDVLYTELLLRTADKRPEAGSLRDRKKNAGRAIRKLSTGPKAVFILGDEYVTEVQ